MAAFLAVNMSPPTISQAVGRHKTTDQPQSRNLFLSSSAGALSRRKVVSCLVLSWVLRPYPVAAGASGEEPNVEDGNDEGVIGAIKSIFDPNEKTKSGKVLPKAYLKSAREVVKTLRDSLSLKADPRNIVEFRRNADAAKESIRDYLNNWRGQKTVVNEESYIMLEKAIRSLASFYSRAGPSAPLPEEVKTEILGDLSEAEEFL